MLAPFTHIVTNKHGAAFFYQSNGVTAGMGIYAMECFLQDSFFYLLCNLIKTSLVLLMRNASFKKKATIKYMIVAC